jgi:hypothetical protein
MKAWSDAHPGDVHFIQRATILGGRYDGHEVDYCGSRVTYKGEEYVALRNSENTVYYLLAAMVREWYAL